MQSPCHSLNPCRGKDRKGLMTILWDFTAGLPIAVVKRNPRKAVCGKLHGLNPRMISTPQRMIHERTPSRSPGTTRQARGRSGKVIRRVEGSAGGGALCTGSTPTAAPAETEPPAPATSPSADAPGTLRAP